MMRVGVLAACLALISGSEHSTEAEDKEFFSSLDQDGSSFLEENNAHNANEIAPLVKFAKDAKVHDFDWRQFDEDKDGRMSRAEFSAAGRHAGARVSLIQEVIHKLETDAPTEEVDKLIFDRFDADHSGYLEASEVKSLAGQSQGVNIHLADGDTDRDGRWSYAEFKDAEPDTETFDHEHEEWDDEGDDASFIDEGEEEEDHHTAEKHAGDASWTPAQFQEVFKDVDHDGSGALDPKEVAYLQQVSNWDLPDWKVFDHDNDGKLDLGEFVAASKKVMSLASLATPPEEDEEFDEPHHHEAFRHREALREHQH